jgi:hypothetical protein
MLPKLTYANVIATLALFLALGGGGAFAATQLAKNSVGTKQLKKNAVTAAKVKDGSLLAKDFKAGQVPAGPQGPKGAPGATDVVVRYGFEGQPKEFESDLSYAACATGETVVGGGYDFLEEGPENFEFFVLADRPSVETQSEGSTVWTAPADGTPARGWLTEIENETSDTVYFRAYVLCARP